ncbi:sensor histidine kinase [Oceanobacillus halotolerans]|uniref:sensor histidine kinase n=1 Tax=Oceanobacillus halotolerans TaxID=2663380 RepID=UPI0013DB5C8E|nr:HAMP domain-containing sensor histidine kinase [Oceanobacillus halotolerans]
MKLHYQLNIAFTTLLVVIMSVTGYVIYSLILDLLIQDEQRQLEQKGEILVSVLNEGYSDQQDFRNFLQEQDLQLFLYDSGRERVLYSTLPSHMVTGFILNNDFTDDTKALWEYQDDKFVTSRILFYPESVGYELILLTPLNDLEAVRHNFIARLFIVFLIGAGVAILLSYLLTNKLVTPLTKLKRQLKKIEKRQFDQVESVKASGEIKELEQSVFDMATELERYMKSQQTFFQNASHELKTPLMTIQGYAEGIRDRVFDEKDEQKGLEMLVTEVNRLKKIINEMILLTKLDSEQAVYKPDQVEVSLLLEQIADRTLPLKGDKEVTVDTNVEKDATLYVDQEKMLQALLNITVNAIRHANSKVHVSVRLNDKASIIMVEDDGPGIQNELLPHIFHRFVKGKNGETGLGLAIARAIVEQSGGQITVHKSRYGGAMFKMIFPNK